MYRQGKTAWPTRLQVLKKGQGNGSAVMAGYEYKQGQGDFYHWQVKSQLNA
jgi:hypothetical protein